MPELAVAGALLHFEKFGAEGPLLLFIPGADGRGSVFHPAAEILSAHFTVICWDRRGYSKSFLIGRQDFNNRLQTDADDAFRLIQHLSTSGKAVVFGTSSGAVIALKLLASHPKYVSKLVAHEPPAFSVLPEESREQATGLVNHIYEMYRANGPEAAMGEFTGGLSEGADANTMRHCMDAKRGDEIRANSLFWFEFELRQYTSAYVDLESIHKVKDKLILVAGVHSGDGPGVAPTKVIAGVLGKGILRISGGHVGYMLDPQNFSEEILHLVS